MSNRGGGKNLDDLYNYFIDALGDSRGAVHDLYEKDKGDIGDYCYLLADTMEYGKFKHAPVPAELEEALKPGTCLTCSSLLWETK